MLGTAAASGECLIAELLLANCATPAGSDVLHAAAAGGQDDVLKLLLAKPAASPTAASSSASFSCSFTSIDAAGRDGKTPLRPAAEAGRRDAVRALLDAGARCDVDGATALHAAVRLGDETGARRGRPAAASGADGGHGRC
ncbi:unnamed protein product [Urochloa humidicola]